jgi:uncharacterized protein YkwD
MPAAMVPLAQAAGCSAVDPAGDFPGFAQTQWNTDQDIQNNFTAARAAEGCNTALVLPAGYDTMTAQQQMLWLFNNEREVRGENDLNLDSTLMSQIALNHSQEMAQYGFTDHPSPINQPLNDPVFGRSLVNPAIANNNTGIGENIAWAYPVAIATFSYLYIDASQGWGHRNAIFNPMFTWVGIGALQNVAASADGNYYTDDFLASTTYTPPPVADTQPPVVGAITYANGTASVTGVADGPNNVNDTGANPATAGITGVMFYTNNIVENPDSTFNTVAATQTAPGSGTWTAPITVNPGDVLHAVAVDGSGNYTDMSPPPPAMTLNAGTNTIAVPAAGTGQPQTMVRRSASAQAVHDLRPSTSTASALVKSIDKQVGPNEVVDVRTYVKGHWRYFYPNRSSDFPLYPSQGVVLRLKAKGTWRPPAGQERFVLPTVSLNKGWNFVAAPYPVTHLTCHATRIEMARHGDTLKLISIGPKPDTGIIMHPGPGDQNAIISDESGFWVKSTGSMHWFPSPAADGTAGPGIK